MISGIAIAGVIFLMTFVYLRFYYKIPPLGDDLVVHVPEPKMLFGLKADSFHIEENNVARNQNLSDILLDRGVSAQTIDQLAKNSVKVFDVRARLFLLPSSTRAKFDGLMAPCCRLVQILTSIVVASWSKILPEESLFPLADRNHDP